jgi:biopolymer transport protein ExbD
MRRKYNQGSQMPEVNLVPMMDVVMTVLTFFIIISMTLTSLNAVDVPLPPSDASQTKEKPAEPLIVEMNRQGQLLVANNLVTESQLTQQMRSFIQANRKSAIILRANEQLSYEKVVQQLGKMRAVAGDRVSLATD